MSHLWGVRCQTRIPWGHFSDFSCLLEQKVVNKSNLIMNLEIAQFFLEPFQQFIHLFVYLRFSFFYFFIFSFLKSMVGTLVFGFLSHIELSVNSRSLYSTKHSTCVQILCNCICTVHRPTRLMCPNMHLQKRHHSGLTALILALAEFGLA